MRCCSRKPNAAGTQVHRQPLDAIGNVLDFLAPTPFWGLLGGAQAVLGSGEDSIEQFPDTSGCTEAGLLVDVSTGWNGVGPEPQ